MRIRKNKTQRASRYGYPVVEATPELHEELTEYGTLKYRKPLREGEFVGRQGTKPEAIVLDIDGTLTEYGSTANQKTLDWCKKHHDAGRVLIVITARTHEHDFQRSFDWLVAHVPYPFIGPIHRSVDDPRYASEFKRETIEVLAQLYTIRGAADDNVHVLGMYKNHFGPDFDLLECSYGEYADWRRDLKPGTNRPAGTRTFSESFASDTGWNDYSNWEDTFSQDRLDSKTERLDLEDQVFADYPDISLSEIEALDIEVLRQMAADAAVDETAPLDVEVLDASDGGTDITPECLYVNCSDPRHEGGAA